MGLLDKKKTANTTQTFIKYLDFTFKGLEDIQVEELLKIYRRLLIRGIKIEEKKFNSESKLAVINREHDITFFKLGSDMVEIDDHVYKENFFQLIYKKEIWNVFCQRITDPEDSHHSSDENPVTQFIVEYIPEKIGRESENNIELMKNIALSAMNTLENEDRLQSYLNSLYDVLGVESVEDVIRLEDTWYNILFKDEVNRNLQDANEKTQEDMGLVDPQFELKLTDAQIVQRYFLTIEDYVLGTMHIEPKIYAISGKDFAIARIFNDDDFEEVVGSEGKAGFVRYFVASFRSASALIKVMEYTGIDTVVVTEILYFDKFDMTEKAMKTNIERGIKTLYDVQFMDIKVECSGELIIEQKEKIVVKSGKGDIYEKFDKLDRMLSLDNLLSISGIKK